MLRTNHTGDTPKKLPPKRTALESAEAFAKIGVTLIAAAMVTPFLGALHWFIELGSHFVHWYFLGALLCTIILLVRHCRRWAIIGLVCVLVNAGFLLPWYLPSASSGATSNVRILHANILTSNTNHDTFLDLVRAVDPDIISVQENNVEWQRALRALDEAYPHSRAVPRGDNFGIAFYTRLPTEEIEALIIAASEVPAIKAKISGAGRAVALLSVHTLPPVGRAYTEVRKAQLAAMPALFEAFDGPAILIGDLNTTMSSPYYRDLESATGLRNARYGFGLGATWPAHYSVFGLPLDHVLVSPEIEVVSFRVGPDIGSDHLPIIVELYPPKHIKHTSVPSWLKKTRRAGAAVCTIIILVCGICLWMWGFSSLPSRDSPDGLHQRWGFVCFAIPPLALASFIASVCLKAVYGFLPR